MNNAAENNTQKNNNGISQKDDRCCKLSVVVSVYNEEKAGCACRFHTAHDTFLSPNGA